MWDAEKEWVTGKLLERQGSEEEGADVLAHLHSVRGRRGRSLYDRGTGNCRQSWHKSGHRLGQRSTHRCLWREEDMLLKTSTNCEKNPSIFHPPFMTYFPLSVFCVVLYSLFAASWDGSNHMLEGGKKIECLLKGRGLLRESFYCGSPLESCSFPFRCSQMEFSKYFWNNKRPQQESKKVHCSPNNGSWSAVLFSSVGAVNHHSFYHTLYDSTLE